MKTKHIIVSLIIVLVILFFVQKKEHAGTVPAPSSTLNLSNEAIQNIAKIYADTNNTATFNNINTIGKITGNFTGNVTGNVTGNLVSPDSKYSLNVDNSGNLSLFNEKTKMGTYVLTDSNNNFNINGKQCAW